MSFLRRQRVPAAVRAVLLLPGDRRVAWSLTSEGHPVVASVYGLTLPESPLLEWRLIEKATWQRPELLVQALAPDDGATQVEGAGPLHRLMLVDGGNLPAVIRTKVTDSVGWSRHLPLPGEGGARVVGRRRRGWEVLDWQLVYDAGTDASDPRVRAAAEQALAAARRTVG